MRTALIAFASLIALAACNTQPLTETVDAGKDLTPVTADLARGADLAETRAQPDLLPQPKCGHPDEPCCHFNAIDPPVCATGCCVADICALLCDNPDM